MEDQFSDTCTTYLVQNGIPNSTEKHFLGIKIMEMQLFETCTTYLVQNGIPNSTQNHFFGIKIMEMQLFVTCTTYLVQNGIPNSTKRGPKPHFVVRGGPIRAQPARPASLAASAGRWAWPAGGPRWQPMGQLAAISRCSSWQWVRAEVEREEAGQTTAPPPHSYHRRWVIW